MNKEQILSTIRSLANSQGCYTRFYKEVLEEPKILEILEEQQFRNVVDLILFLEN